MLCPPIFAVLITPVFAIAWGQALAGFVLFSVSLFLILLILIQRGRGGGLSGAFGGMGGQSAFGAKAGDTFTRVTIVAAAVWILISILSVRFLGAGRVATSVFNSGDSESISPAEDDASSDLELPATSESDSATEPLTDTDKSIESTAVQDEATTSEPDGAAATEPISDTPKPSE